MTRLTLIPGNRPSLTVIAGPNGSGKSTLTQQLLGQGVDFGVYINPDEIAKELAGAYDERVRAAQRIADERRDDCIREKRDFSFETVMSHPSKLEIMRRARNAGFHVTLFFVGTDDPDINVARVQNRVALGGHDVPEDRIRERYERAMAALFDAILIADVSVVFDNTMIDGAITPIVRIHRSKEISLRSKFCRRGPDGGVEIDAGCPRWVVTRLLRPLQSSGLEIVDE